MKLTITVESKKETTLAFLAHHALLEAADAALSGATSVDWTQGVLEKGDEYGQDNHKGDIGIDSGWRFTR